MGDKFTVTAPIESYEGLLGGLVFRAGKATADSKTDARALAYCHRHGYTVEPAKAGDDDSPSGESTRPKATAPKGDWVAYAISCGADSDVAVEMTKADLIDQYGKEGSSDG